MSAVPGYTLLEEVSQGREAVLLRGIRTRDGHPVLLKVLREEYPPPTALARLQAEYELTRALRIPGALAPLELESVRHRAFLVFEDFAGLPLRRLISAGPLELVRWLDIAILLADTLGELHARDIIHKGLSPETILVDPLAGRLKLTDLSFASRLVRESHEPGGPGPQAWRLAYLSPEQTGRMNRAVDHRADLYSLGVILYELLTGVRPFEAVDPVELVHSHLARQPPSPQLHRPGCPLVLARLVLKLLAKMAEDRYQSASGLAADLREASRRAGEGTHLPDFPLGREDVLSTFSIPEKAYGREREVEALVAALERVSREDVGLVLISGPAGIGKTLLVHELHKPLAVRRGQLVSGKCDQLQRDIPYSSLAQAFRSLLRLLLAEDPPSVAAWKHRLLAAVSPHGRLLTDLLPELELLIGPQPPVPELSTAEARARFGRVFERFIAALTGPERPLVLFLDDMQWADSSSLDLLQKLLAAPAARSLLLLFSFRDGEVSAAHPFMLMVEALRQQGRPVSGLRLGPLGREDVRRLLADTLAAEPARVEPLADIVLAKTGGNPFFLHQLLRSLHAGGLIAFDRSARRWRWDAERIQQAPHTDNVVALMTEKLQRLPLAVQDVLKRASCVGSRFDLRVVARISQLPPADAARLLWEAVREGLLLPVSGELELLHAARPELDWEAASSGTTYRFLHDRVQQAAYSLIPEAQRPALHLTLGRLLWRRDARPEEQGFEVVNQLNLGRQGLEDAREREAAAELNLVAARRAKAASAYAAAANYFRVGSELLGEDGWGRRFDLLWPLTVERAECEYLLIRFAEAEALFDLALARAHTRLQVAQVYKTQVILYTNLGKYQDACRRGVEALRLLGVDWPEDDAGVAAALARERGALRGHLHGQPLEALLELPEETDPERLATGMLLAHLISPFYHGHASKDREWLVVCLLVGQVLRTRRHSDAGAYGLASYAVQLASAGDYANGYAIGRLAMEVADKHGFAMSRGRNYTLFGGLINHWTRPARSSAPYLLQAYKLLSESGDLIYGVYACNNLITLALVRGDPVEQVEAEVERYLEFVRQTQYMGFVRSFAVYLQYLQCLRGAGETPWELPALGAGEAPRTQAVWCLSQLKVLYLAGRYAEAAAVGAEAERRIPTAVLGSPLVPESRFFHALSLAAAGRGPQGEDVLAPLARAVEDFRTWAAACPANFRQQQLLLEAELARLGGGELEAMRLYDEAIEAAEESGYLHLEALGNELAARLHLQAGRRRAAGGYLREAHHAWSRWGAAAKVAQLEARYPLLLGPRAPGADGGARPGWELPLESGGSVLDLLTVTRSFRVLSGEIHLRTLLEKLIRMVMENAGSQRAVLLLPRGEVWFLEAEATVDTAESVVLQPTPLEATAALPRSVIHYVIHTREHLVLGDATRAAPYLSDPDVAARQVRSILCLPVVAHQRLVGVLYLEHRTATDVFTPDRLHVLTLLSAQAAISIENARLYDTLEQRVEARTRELTERNAQLATALQRLHETQRLLVEKEKLASLGAMTSAIAHEVKNPLNFINNFARLSRERAGELLEEVARLGRAPTEEQLATLSDLAGELRMLTAKVNEHGDRVNHIIGSMRQHSAESRVARTRVDLNRLLAEHVALAIQPQRALSPAVELTTHYDGTLGPVSAAPGELGRVFINLVQNACHAALARYRQDATEPPRVRVSSRNLGTKAEVRVWDNGAGIPAEVRGRIFSPFFTTKPPGEGTGLGLSISYNIVVQLHGGELRFESEPGQGTEFIVTLPWS